MHRDKYFFSLGNFKKWMDGQDHVDHTLDKYTGQHVASKVSSDELVSEIATENDDDLDVIIESFIKHGGIVTEVNGRELTIKTKKGLFAVDKRFIKIK